MLSAVVALCMSSCKDDDEDCSYSVATSDAVDLGLSVKWARCNLGATNREDYGDYFTWGETKSATDSECTWESYKYANGAKYNLTKYVPEARASKDGYNGFFDNKTVLDPEDDAAHVVLGGKWRMPTKAEWEELYNNCTFTWTRINGVQGCLVTSNKEGFADRSIFLPAAGHRSNGVTYQGSTCSYWSTSHASPLAYFAEYWFFNEKGLYYSDILDRRDRSQGLPIRPVSE